MKRILKILIIVLILSFTFSLSSCNDGSIDELYGVYGFSSLFYKTKDDQVYNYADEFDYIVLVVKEDQTIDCYIKRHDGEEITYSYTYTITTKENSKGKTVVSSITLNKFIVLDNYSDSDKAKENNYSFSEIEDVTLNFGSLTNNLKLKIGSIKLEDGSFKSYHYKNNYSKLYKRTSEFNIKRAKNKQIKERLERLEEINDEE